MEVNTKDEERRMARAYFLERRGNKMYEYPVLKHVDNGRYALGETGEPADELFEHEILLAKEYYGKNRIRLSEEKSVA